MRTIRGLSALVAALAIVSAHIAVFAHEVTHTGTVVALKTAKYAQPSGGSREVVELEVVVVDPKTKKASNRVFTITDKTRLIRPGKPVKIAEQALAGFIMRSTACNAVHSVEQRLARWLLMARYRMGSDDFPVTQEFVAMMLGASRPTVTIVAGTLEKAGLITYRRGQVTIVDREGLEAASCECYRVTTDLLTP